MIRPDRGPVLDRRRFLRLSSLGVGAVGLAALGSATAGCSSGTSDAQASSGNLDYILPTDPEVHRPKRPARASGATASFALARGRGRRGRSRWPREWTRGRTAGNAGGPRTAARPRATGYGWSVANGLPADTTLHWHGIRIRNDMDGAAPVTQPAIGANGGTFEYDFVAPDPGTYWYHSHSGRRPTGASSAR